MFKKGEMTMNIIPFTTEKGELARLHKDMDDLVSSFFGGRPTLFSEREIWPALSRIEWPAIDINEDENAITVKAEVPGCKAEDVDISVQGNTLTISGEKKHEEEKKEKGYYYAERSYGSFRRDLTLPAEVDSTKINAACKDGVLTINLPKSEKAKAVKVKVKGQ
jgi:HSP20 family protein